MKQETFKEKQENSISLEVFTVSAGLIGVCITIIGIINIITASKHTQTIADDIACFDALVFLAACICSYFSMKVKNNELRFKMERVIDIIFLMGLSILAFVGILIVYYLNQG